MNRIFNTDEVDGENLKVGDLLIHRCYKQIGIVTETGTTLLHEHKFIKIKWLEKVLKTFSCNWNEHIIKEHIEKIYIPNSEKFFRIVRY